MVASRGQIPKREEARRRTNKVDGEEVTKAPGAELVEMPEPDEDWHNVAYDWYLSLENSGQSVFYEPSDWMTAYVLAEQLSRLLNPRPQGLMAVMVEVPMSGSDLGAILKGMSALMVTEGDRRRMRLELTRGGGEDEELPADVRAITSAKSALEGAS